MSESGLLFESFHKRQTENTISHFLYSGDLKSGLVWFQMVKKRLVCKWSGFYMGSEIRKPNHLKSGQMAAIWIKNHLKCEQKCPDFEWAGFRIVRTKAMAKAKPFENWTN